MEARDQVVLARQLAALRGEGMSVLDALNVLWEPLPAGELRTELGAVRSELAAGAASPTPRPPLLALLARGEQASSQALAHLAEALELVEKARQSSREATRLLAWAGGVGLVLLSAAGFLMPRAYLGAELAGPSQVVMRMFSVLSYAGPALLVALLVWLRLRPISVPGTALMRSASRAMEFSAALEGGLDEAAAAGQLQPGAQGLLDLKDPAGAGLERLYYGYRRERAGPARAAREVAEHLGRRAEGRLRAFQRWAPVLAAAALLPMIALYLFMFFQPMFAIARSLR